MHILEDAGHQTLKRFMSYCPGSTEYGEDFSLFDCRSEM